jgi:phospholipid transport system substrate-binding protein
MWRYLNLACLTLMMGLISTSTEAQQDDALEFLKAKHLRVEQILKASKGKSQESKEHAELTEALNELLDYDELAKRSLERHWDERKPKERQQFVDLLRKLVQRNYEQNLNDTLDYNIRYHDARKDADGVVVRATAKSKQKSRAPTVTIEYTMHRVGAGWKVLDVNTDGVSLVRNYRSQFARIIRKHGWNELIRRMQVRLETNAEL